jgi:broad specificity phosphatase PhoE
MLLLIRHATTDLAGKLCGQIDPELNDLGHTQAQALADSLRTTTMHRVYSSDLLRSLQTAEPLARGRDIPILQRPDLREISFGAWEGMRWAAVQAQSGFPIEAIESSPQAAPPEGEPFPRFRDRVIHALNEIALESSRQTIVAVTHLGVIRVALMALAKIDPASPVLRIAYCSVHAFEVSNGIWTFTGRV